MIKKVLNLVKSDNIYLRRKYVLWILMGFYSFINVITNLFNFNYLTDKSKNPNFLNWHNHDTINNKFLYVFGSSLSVLGATGLILMATRRYSGLIQCLIYNIIVGSMNFVFNSSESVINIFVNIPLLLLSLVSWIRNMDTNNNVRTQIITKKWLYLVLLLVSAGFISGYYYMIEGYNSKLLLNNYVYTNRLNKILDSFVRGLTVSSSLLLVLRNMESWILLIVVSILNIVNNSFELNINNIATSLLLLITSVYGLVEWNTNDDINLEKSEKQDIEMGKSKFISKVILDDEKTVILSNNEIKSSKYHKEISTKSTFNIESSKLEPRDEAVYTKKITPVIVDYNERETVRGVIIGRFLPLHNGHIEFINKVLERCSELHIILLCRDDDEINQNMRVKWISEMFNDVRIYAVRNVLTENNDLIWISQMSVILGFKADVLYMNGQENLEEIRKMTSVRVENVECESKVRSVNVRLNVMRNFGKLSEPAKGYYARRVIIMNKSAVEVARQLDVPFVERYLEERKEEKYTNDEIIQMARYQNQLEDMNARHSEGRIVCEGDSLMLLYENNVNTKVEKELRNIYNEIKTENRLYIIVGKNSDLETFLMRNNVKMLVVENETKLMELIEDL
jgi:cytidyltransferase-like protein